MIQTIIEGFLLGVATGHLCVATCGPVYAPFLMQKEQGGVKGSLMMVLKISGGRFLAYALFGLVAGALGREISGVNRTWFTIISFILLSVVLLNSVFVTTKKNHAACGVTRWGKVVTNPILLGIITGINFCPSFLIALTNAINLSGPLAGLLLFTSFFVGTNIFLIPFSIFGLLGSKQVFRKVAMAASVIVAVTFTVRAGVMIRTELMPDPRGVITILDEQPVHIFTDQPEHFESLATHLRENYNKVVTIGTDIPAQDSTHYLFVDNLRGSEEAKSLVTSNRFVILLPKEFETPQQISHFLSEYHFFFDEKKGSYFPMEKKES